MLWTDRTFLTADELATLDGEIKEVASANELVLEDSGDGNGIINRSIEEASDTLMKHMQVFGGYLTSGSVSANHNAAVMNIGQPAVNRSKILIGQVVVTGLNPKVWTPLKRWVAYWVLHAFYRNAANRKVSDRYDAKQLRYLAEATGTYWDALRTLGIPIVQQPLPAPGAVWEPNAGIWGDACLSTVAGAGMVDAPYDFAVSYVDTTVSVNNESAPSLPVTVALTSGQVGQVSISPLVPPTGAQHPGTVVNSIVSYLKAGGWNVYAGVTGGPLYLQNTTPIPIATKTYTLAADPVLSGTCAGAGQWPDRYMAMAMGQIQRG